MQGCKRSGWRPQWPRARTVAFTVHIRRILGHLPLDTRRSAVGTEAIPRSITDPLVMRGDGGGLRRMLGYRMVLVS